MSEARLQVRNVSVSFGRAQVLTDLSLTVEAGEVVALVGPNGAGKTTALRAISGLVERGGDVLLDGRVLKARPDAVVAAGIVHVPEGRGLIPNLTVLQNLRLGAIAVRRDVSRDDLETVRSVFPRLAPLMDRRAGLISGGEQQMVAIARGLLAKPRVLMVDELSLGLAPRVVSEILEALLEKAREQSLTLLLVDQNVRALENVSDRLYVLKSGRAVVSDPGSHSAITDVYFGTSQGADE